MVSTLLQQAVTAGMLCGWCLITAGLGRLCLGISPLNFASRGEGLFLSAGVGVTVSAYAVFLLGVAQLLNPTAIASLLIIMASLALAGWLRPLPLSRIAPSARSPWDRAPAVLLAVVLAAGFVLVLTPETGKDALIYHLAVPKSYLRHGGFYFIPGNVFAGYPLLGELHYLLALFIRNDVLAKTIHFALLCLTLAGIGLFTRHLMGENAFPALAMLTFASIPSVFAVSHTAYNDLFVAFFTVAAVYAFLRWSEYFTPGWLILSAFFTGSAAACKYTALLLLPLGCLGILYFSRRAGSRPAPALRTIALYAAAAFIAGSPFYLKNWIVTGNPFYPFLYGLFGGLGWDADQARLYDLFIQGLGMGREFLDYILLPWNVSFRARPDSPQFDGILGPVFILTLPFLAGIRRWETPVRVLIVCAAAAFLFWASSAQQIRYLIPPAALLAICVGAIVTRYRERKAFFYLLVLLIGGSLAFNGSHIFRDFTKINPVHVAVGLESREAFLSRLIPPYRMYGLMNRKLSSQDRVFLIYMKNYTFLCEGDCYADAMFETHTLQKILRASSSPGDVRDRLKKERFTHIMYDEAYLLGALSPLSPEEKGLFEAFRESSLFLLARQNSYRLDRMD